MLYGFTFNDIHSSVMGLAVHTKNKPIIPTPKTITSDISSRNGVLDYSKTNPFGHILFNKREISLECSFIVRSLEEVRKRARLIAAWLAFPEAKLIFDDEPDVYYIARVSNRLDLEQQMFRGYFQIVFSCEPYAKSVVKSGVAPSYGDKFLAYDGTNCYGGNNVFSITEPRQISVSNKGSFVSPIINIQGSFDEISLTFKNKSLICYTPLQDGILSIDCGKMKATVNKIQNALPIIQGDFFEFENGENSIGISGSGLDCVISFEFNYLYL